MSAEVVVVGGGIIGATTAYELARAGVEVLVLEADRFGRASTGKSAAIVRCHYSNPEVVRMALRSRERFRQLPLLLECDPVYTRSGWLFLVEESDAELARDNVEMQVEQGLDLVEPDELAELLPGVEERGVAYAVYEPDSGFADPVAATESYLAAARRAGAETREHSPVEAIVVEAGRVRGVRVGGELVSCGVVVLAAGPWSLALARSAGLELPLEITREQDVVFATGAEPTLPCAVSSQVDRVYMRPAPEAGGAHLLAGRGFPKLYESALPDDYDEQVDAPFTADVQERVRTRLPRLHSMRAVGGRAGLYDVTPDWHPLLGPVGDPDGLVLATGGSGHCFKLAPALGELVSAQILGRQLGYADAASFALSRFERGEPFRSTYGGNRA
jgi:glycine/D-amino acid oxidase-like deaminating enzyme